LQHCVQQQCMEATKAFLHKYTENMPYTHYEYNLAL
jgi:hypothetical protein